MPLINILAPSSAFGFNTDVEIILQALNDEGYTFILHRSPYTAGRVPRLVCLAKGLLTNPRRADANLHVGPIFKEWLPLARMNFILPNPEWFFRDWMPLLRHFDVVFAKTVNTEKIFAQLGCKVIYTGFASLDAFRAGHFKDFDRYLHISSNRAKGTPRILETWSRHPEWPLLTAVINRAEIGANSRFEAVATPNLRLIRDYLSDDAIRTLQNECGVHICCSEAEGYGHYIAEAMSTGAVTITTDGPPMNELVQPKRGVLVAAAESLEMNMSKRYLFDPIELDKNVDMLQDMPEAKKAELGCAARAWFLTNKDDFGPRFKDAFATAMRRKR